MKEIAEKLMGYSGRMIAYSKSGYVRMNPFNLVVFNSNLVVHLDEVPVKIWHGDLDITKDEQKLLSLSAELGRDLYVLYEHDARFENEENPRTERFVYKCSPDGAHELRQYELGYTRIDGKLMLDNRSIKHRAADAVLHVIRMPNVESLDWFVREDQRKTVRAAADKMRVKWKE